jgi:hypothetical protein
MCFFNPTVREEERSEKAQNYNNCEKAIFAHSETQKWTKMSEMFRFAFSPAKKGGNFWSSAFVIDL